MILMGFSIINYPFGGTSIYGNPQILIHFGHVFWVDFDHETLAKHCVNCHNPFNGNSVGQAVLKGTTEDFPGNIIVRVY